jgi:PAS domain S-box-containing protein
MDYLLGSTSNQTLSSPVELHDGVASLSRGTFFKEASLDMTLSVLAESAGQMSGVERVSIWALTAGYQELRCLELFQRRSGEHSSGEVLRAEQYPAYFRALEGVNGIAADDPYLHPATIELGRDYLLKHRITALLDTPIHIRGELQGVLCLEQVDSHAPWTTAQRIFAQAVANLVTLALVEFEAGEARRQVVNANERLKAVFEGSRDALLLADGDSGLVLDANAQAEKLFGCQRSEIVGKHQKSLHPNNSESVVSEQFRQVASGQLSTVVVTEVLCANGAVKAVEITAEVADLSDGHRLVLGIFRQI